MAMWITVVRSWQKQNDLESADVAVASGICGFLVKVKVAAI